MCVWVGRACSTWSVRRQEPPAVGAHGAPAVGSFKKSLYVALVRGRRTREELLARRDRCVCSGSSADPNAGFSYDVASCEVQVSFRFKAACICTDTTAFPQASMKSLQYGAVLVLLLASLQSTQAETSVCHSIVGEEMCSTISSYLEFLPPSVRPPTKVNFG